MCGIYGIVDGQRRPISRDLAAAMDSSLLHRGPDGSGQFFEAERYPGVLLGNRRLAIIDVAGGNQPFVSDDGQIAVVQNGEIFNYIELQAELKARGVRLDTDSDTEVILRLYEQGGIDALKALNGMFAIAIWDGRAHEQALYLVRDRVGEKPLYVHEHTGPHAGRVSFASEIKTLLVDAESSGGKPGLDLQAIDQYLALNYIPAPRTAFKGISHVMPGHVWRFDGRNASTWRWWNLAEQHAVSLPVADWNAEFLHLLDDATRIRMRSDVPFGAFLSGGVDSSSIVGLMAGHSSKPINTFCIGFADPRFDETRFAQEAATRFGTRHTAEIAELDMLSRWQHCLFHCDQPHGDASFMPTLRVSELAAKHVKVVLTGDGGDELFGGYEKYAAFFGHPANAQLQGDALGRAYVEATGLFGHTQRQALYNPGIAAQLGASDVYAEVAKPWFDQAQHMDPVNRALYFDTQALLSGNNLVKPDRMGMAASIENRAPFLDWRVIEFAFRTPGNHKLHHGDLKHRYKNAVVPLIGEHLALRKKQMFTVPVGEWFKDDRHAWLAQNLQSSPLLAELFQPPKLTELLAQHKSGTANHTRELRALLALALWADAFAIHAV